MSESRTNAPFAATQVAGPESVPTDPVVADDPERSRAAAGDYQLGALLGRGGMGEVVLARDPKLGRDVALKRMRGASASDDAIARFLREAKIQARLDHPAIVPVHEVGLDADGRPFFTMKRLAGTTLVAKLESHATPQKELLRALIDVCQAIALAHARGVVHRDLKPANIMLGDYGEVYVLDWGIARVFGTGEAAPEIDSLAEAGEGGEGGEGGERPGATRAGVLLGTPGYMSPEQASGDAVGPPADVYALGAMLFEILTGEPLHPRGMDALASTLEPGPRSAAARCPDRVIAPELDALCEAALATDPAVRPTAAELAAKLQRYLDGDRDTEHRRALAADQVAVARAAYESGDPARRSEAVHAAGRALVLDPTATDAAELVSTLLVEPPRQLPPLLAAAVAEDERLGVRRRSKRALLPFASFFLLSPILPWGDPAAVPALVGMHLSIAGTMVIAFINWRIRWVPSGVFLLLHACTAVMFSRLLGPFALTPTLICGMLLATTSTPWITARPWAVAVWVIAVALAPFGLEWLGWFASTWHIDGTGLHSRGVLLSGTGYDVPLAIGAHVAALLVVARYARRIADDRRVAQRELLIHAWHLKQLLPRASTEAT